MLWNEWVPGNWWPAEGNLHSRLIFRPGSLGGWWDPLSWWLILEQGLLWGIGEYTGFGDMTSRCLWAVRVEMSIWPLVMWTQKLRERWVSHNSVHRSGSWAHGCRWGSRTIKIMRELSEIAAYRTDRKGNPAGYEKWPEETQKGVVFVRQEEPSFSLSLRQAKWHVLNSGSIQSHQGGSESHPVTHQPFLSRAIQSQMWPLTSTPGGWGRMIAMSSIWA